MLRGNSTKHCAAMLPIYQVLVKIKNSEMCYQYCDIKIMSLTMCVSGSLHISRFASWLWELCLSLLVAVHCRALDMLSGVWCDLVGSGILMESPAKQRFVSRFKLKEDLGCVGRVFPVPVRY